MHCPGCGLTHPSQYQTCVSCGTRLSDGGSDEADEAAGADSPPPAAIDEEQPKSLRRSKNLHHQNRSGIPTTMGILLAVMLLLISAGVTLFIFTKPPDEDKYFAEGQKALQNRLYATAVERLTKAASVRPNDPRVFLSLARAYVGTDQIDKANECISQAQQLGAGVVAEPELASELAGYYRQRNQYQKALDLLRPLAKEGIAGKKAELADLDALWGDELLRNGELEKALRCWEEVRDLREGSRFAEAEARLATIYQKLANKLAASRNDDQALSYLSKLNTIAQNAKNFELAADIYERNGQLELAIDQLRKSMNLAGKQPGTERRLASLLSRRGKELLDKGDTDTGYAYLQQARQMDPQSAVPDVTLRNLQIGSDGGYPSISGEVWNPSDNALNSLSVKVQLYDTKNGRSLWEKEQRLVDEFVPPLESRQSKSFAMQAGAFARSDGTVEFRVYLDGALYKSYPIGEKSRGTASGGVDAAPDKPTRVEATTPAETPEKQTETVVPPAPPRQAPTPGETGGTETADPNAPKPLTPEEKTMKDLGL